MKQSNLSSADRKAYEKAVKGLMKKVEQIQPKLVALSKVNE